MNELEAIIYNIKSSRESHNDIIIPFDVSHIVLNALLKQIPNSNPAEFSPDDELECGNCGNDTFCRDEDEICCKYCGQKLIEN